MTPLAKAILTLLKQHDGPLTVPAMLEALEKKHLHPNKTTIYRQIQKLKDARVITEVVLKNGIAFYEHSLHHHHHFFCEACESVFCLEDEALERSIHRFEDTITDKQFKVKRHEFNLYGLCRECVQRNADGN